ncbi:RNA polymerase sigma factor, partial [candidate division KSB1 bacterium]
LYTYLYAIMLNKIKKYYTKKKFLKLKVRELQHIEIKADNEYEKFERKELISKIIVQMPLKYKSVLILRFFEDLSYSEISDIIGWKLGTVKSRLFKAHNILKKKLEKYNA